MPDLTKKKRLYDEPPPRNAIRYVGGWPHRVTRVMGHECACGEKFSKSEDSCPSCGSGRFQVAVRLRPRDSKEIPGEKL